MRRKALIICLALLLIIFGVFFLRLDSNKLSISVQSQFQQWAGQKVQVGSASFNLLHGASLHIQDVDVRSEKQMWHLHADNIRLNLSMWSLLRGETRIKSVELIHPVLDFSRSPQVKTLAMMALPKALNLMRIRQGLIRISGRPVVRGFDSTVRRVNRGQELTWELQTKLFDGNITTQGHIRYDTQGRRSVFGRLKAKHIHFKDFSGSSRKIKLQHLVYDTFGTSLTFDANPDQTWNLFGDAMLHAKNAPPVIWRGKINGAGWQQLNWQDSFLQIGKKATFSTVGACAYGRGCHFGVDTRNADILPILSMLNMDYPLKGRFDAKSSLSWKNGRWSIAAQLNSHHVSWMDISVPDVNISVPNILYHAPERIDMTNVRLQIEDTNGSITMQKLTKAGHTWSLGAHINNETRAWTPLANILLKSHGIKPELQSTGALNADVKISHDAKHTDVDISMHTDQAQIAYGKTFKKPANIPANMTTHVDIARDRTLLTIAHAKLGDSYSKQMEWIIKHKETQAVSTENFHINLAKLRQNGMVFPEFMKDWHGAIGGHLTDFHPSAETKIPAWFTTSSGQLKLTGFGNGKHQWNGRINIQNGILATQGLRWKNADQHAYLTGVINLSSKQGRMDLQDTTLSWKQHDALPDWITHAKLHGHLRHIDLNWMGTAWSELQGTYHTNGNHITLKKIRAKLAGGSARSPEIAITLSPESVHFSGAMHMAIIRLNKLPGLAEALDVHLDGYMYLNANLEGDIPWHATSDWQGNGDIEIQHAHWQSVDPKLTITAGHLRTEVGKRTSFSRFTTRFRLQHKALNFTRMQLETGAKQISGNGLLQANGEIGGKLQIRDEHGSQSAELIGNWPELSGFFATSTDGGLQK